MIKRSKNITENHNHLIGVKEKQNVETTRGIEYELYPSKGKERVKNVSYTQDLYGYEPDINYNIPESASKNKMKGKSSIKKPKYHPKFDGRVGSTITIGGVNINAIAKYCFTDVRAQHYFIKCIEENDDYEICLMKAIKFEQEQIKKRDHNQREEFLIFNDVDLQYLKLQGIDPNEDVKFPAIKTMDLIDADGNFRAEHFKKLLKHIHNIEN